MINSSKFFLTHFFFGVLGIAGGLSMCPEAKWACWTIWHQHTLSVRPAGGPLFHWQCPALNWIGKGPDWHSRLSPTIVLITGKKPTGQTLLTIHPSLTRGAVQSAGKSSSWETADLGFNPASLCISVWGTCMGSFTFQDWFDGVAADLRDCED